MEITQMSLNEGTNEEYCLQEGGREYEGKNNDGSQNSLDVPYSIIF